MPWQEYVADVAYEVDRRGRLVYDEVVVTVPRQSGKSTLVVAKTAWRLTAATMELGPQRSLYTAQRRGDARKKLERDFAPLLRRAKGLTEVTALRVRPSLPTEWKLSMNNGAEHIQFGEDSYWLIDAPTKDAAHGDTLDDATIDEAFAHRTDDVEQAAQPAQITRTDAQLWVVSTAGDGDSAYLWGKVAAGRAACEAGDHGRRAYFEWSAHDDADFGDPEVWASCSPALGHTITTDRLAGLYQAALRSPDPKALPSFGRAYCNVWPAIPLLGEAAGMVVLPEEHWQACADPGSSVVDPVALAVEVAPDRSWAAVGVAGARADGLVHVEVIRHDQGTSWVAPLVRDVIGRNKVLGVALAGGGPARSLVAELREVAKVFPSADGRPVAPLDVLTAPEVAAACGALYDDVVEHRVRHLGGPTLDAALAGARKRDGASGAWSFDQKTSASDITPLNAVTFARAVFVRRRADRQAGPYLVVLGG